VLRDQFARQMDVPPFKVMNNSVLLDLAQSPPRAARDLFHRAGISRRVARKFASEIYRTIEHARTQDPAFHEIPVRNHWKAPAVSERVRLENLKRWRQVKARELGIHVGVVFPGSFLETLAAYPPADLAGLERIPGIRRWRCAVFGNQILELLRTGRADSEEEDVPAAPGIRERHSEQNPGA
jgi:ribonuclease D